MGIAGRPVTDTISSELVMVAFAFAVEFDIVWGSTNLFYGRTRTTIGLACQGYWKNRSASSTHSADYQNVCVSIVAIIQQGESFLVSEGIDIPDCCCEGSGSQGPQGNPGSQGNQGTQGAQGSQGNSWRSRCTRKSGFSRHARRNRSARRNRYSGTTRFSRQSRISR